MANDVLSNNAGAALDIVKLNAGAALYASDIAAKLSDGIEMAAAALASGSAKNKFEQFIEYSNSFT